MGRPGGGGGRSSGGHSGGGRSSGGHSMGGGRSGGGSRPSGSFGGSRPGGGTGNGAGRGAGPGGARGPMGGAGGPMGGPGGPMGGPGGRPPRRGWFGRFFYGPGYGYGGYGYGGRSSCGCLVTIIIFLIVMVITVITGVVRSATHSSSSSSGRSFWFSSDDNSGYSSDANDISGRYTSDTAREKADTGVAFTSDCVIDELGWIDDVESTGEVLETFYDATGVQPYVYLKAYDDSLTTDSEKEAYAEEWYDENIDNEGTFLYIYFAEEDAENDMGYFVYVCGEDITDVMDDEAIEIFWNYHDDYWYSDLSMGDMLAETFDATAEAIMQ